MTQEELVSLGFKRTDVTAEESGYEADWYYYTYDFGNGSVGLITQANTDIQDDKWHVEVFEDESISYDKYQDVSEFIRIVNKGRKRN